MRVVQVRIGLLLALAAGFLLAGLGAEGAFGGKDKKEEKGKAYDVHKGTWCEEHGVWEDICSLCLPEDQVKKKFKDKGDWCKLHERAKSQCFKCEPKLYLKYEAQYEKKFGKKPPRPPESEFKK